MYNVCAGQRLTDVCFVVCLIYREKLHIFERASMIMLHFAVQQAFHLGEIYTQMVASCGSSRFVFIIIKTIFSENSTIPL